MTRIAPALALLFLSACHKHQLPTTTIQVGEHRMLVEVADDGQERNKGLMLRDHLPANEGMLFVYPESAPRSFWMKNTRIPLSIAFIEPDGTIFHLADMRPMSRKHTPSGGPAMYALEVNRGWFEANGIIAGTKVTGLPGPAAN